MVCCVRVVLLGNVGVSLVLVVSWLNVVSLL